jgi:putative peptidoglycan lipid II flippase
MNLLRSAATVGGYTMISRVLGFVRDILIAGVLGAGMTADAFVVAFRLPNLFRRLVAEGAFTAAFVPMFAQKLEGDGREAARGFAVQVFAVMFWALLAFTIAAEIAMPWVVRALAAGFADEPDKFALTVEFTRITFPYLLCMALVALLGGMLNALYKFAAMAAAPILLNVVLITALLLGGWVFAMPGHWLVWGVAAAGVGQLVWLLIACARAGLAVRLGRPRWNADIKRLLKLMLPGVIGGGVTQINIVVGTLIASFLAEGAVSYLYYADRVYQLPLGVVGVAMGTALLPLLSRQLRAGDDDGAMGSLNRGIELSLLLTLPAAAALLVIPGPIVGGLFQRGQFSPADAQATAWALAAFATGLPAYVLLKVFAPGFFARSDTTTPVVHAAVAMVANVALALILIDGLGHVGIALATAIAAWINAGLLAYSLRKRGQLTLDTRLRHRLPRIVGASLLMAAVLWGLAQLLAAPLAGGEGPRIAALAALVAAGLASFAVFAHVSGAARLQEMRGLARPRQQAEKAD